MKSIFLTAGLTLLLCGTAINVYAGNWIWAFYDIACGGWTIYYALNFV